MNDASEKIKLRDFENHMGAEIDNWCRWGRQRDWLPMSYGNILGKRYRPRNRHTAPENSERPVDLQAAIRIERLVCGIPEQFRQAFILHYVGRVAVNGRIRIARTKEDGARILGIKRAQYYNRINRAAAILIRQM